MHIVTVLRHLGLFNGRRENAPPSVTVTPSFSADTGTTAHVFAVTSDPDGDPVTNVNELAARPIGSSAVLTAVTSLHASVNIDVAGTYIVTATPTDDGGAARGIIGAPLQGNPTSCTITGTTPPPPPPSSTFKTGVFGDGHLGGWSAGYTALWDTQTSTTARYGMCYSSANNQMDNGSLTAWQNWLAGDSRRRWALTYGSMPATPVATWRGHWDDTQWDASTAAFFANIHARGMTPQMVTRVNWEFNGNWYAWGPVTQNTPTGAETAGYIRLFQRVVGIIRANAPGMRINWGASWWPSNTSSWYPGDAYVDVIGMDKYDNWTAGTGEARWANQLPDFQRQVAFAIARGKTTGIDEWGLASTGANQGAGDNTGFINHVADLVTAPANLYEYAIYFDNADGGQINAQLHLYPNSLAAYTTKFAAYTA